MFVKEFYQQIALKHYRDGQADPTAYHKQRRRAGAGIGGWRRHH
jgi:hypothetical protein